MFVSVSLSVTAACVQAIYLALVVMFVWVPTRLVGTCFPSVMPVKVSESEIACFLVGLIYGRGYWCMYVRPPPFV